MNFQACIKKIRERRRGRRPDYHCHATSTTSIAFLTGSSAAFLHVPSFEFEFCEFCETHIARCAHGALGRRKIERGPLWTCRVHRRQLHKGYPIVLPYPKAIVGGLSHSYTSTFLGSRPIESSEHLASQAPPPAPPNSTSLARKTQQTEEIPKKPQQGSMTNPYSMMLKPSPPTGNNS